MYIIFNTLPRFATLSCPLSKEQVRDIEREADIIQELLNGTSTDVRDNLNRIEEFENLILLGEREQGSYTEDIFFPLNNGCGRYLVYTLALLGK